jgi:hypothetical protein
MNMKNHKKKKHSNATGSNRNAPAMSASLAALSCAALALPGMVALAPQHSMAQQIPENGSLSVRYLRYKDAQPGLDRITVSQPSVHLVVPIAGQWSVEASAEHDGVSGATPRAYSVRSSASRMEDKRTGTSLKVTRYFSRGALSVNVASSDEDDYASRGFGLSGSYSSDSKNTTLSLGLGAARDTIRGPEESPVVWGDKRINEVSLGLTQIVSANDIMQFTYTRNEGQSRNMRASSSAYNDPYRLVDRRPLFRNQDIFLVRWNRHFKRTDAALRMAYRYYADTFNIRGHSFEADWVQPVSPKLTLTPSVRYYTQNSAAFYFDPDPNSPVAQVPLALFTFTSDRYRSVDHRLSAFGAVTLGLKASYQIDKDWLVDGKLESYQQRNDWRMGGDGSPGINPLRASVLQIGITRNF